MKEWIEKRLKEMKSDNVIPLHNWKEYYNNLHKKIRNRYENASQAQTLNHSGRGESPNNE